MIRSETNYLGRGHETTGAVAADDQVLILETFLPQLIDTLMPGLEKDRIIEQLKAQIDKADTEKELAVTKATQDKEKELSEKQLNFY